MKIVLRKCNLKNDSGNINLDNIFLSSFEDYCFQLLKKATLIIFEIKINGRYKYKILFSK